MRLAPPFRRRRLVSLTPMIDVVFLILVFFMLASRFTTERALPLLAEAEGGGPWEGAPRLIEVAPASLTFNGAATSLETLREDLIGRVQSDRSILIRPVEGADMQRLTDLLDALRAAGYTDTVLVP